MSSRIDPFFVALDVEWATRDQMICQIGLVKVKLGKIVEHAQWLVQPPGNEYDETLFRYHHIRPEMTANAPTMEQLWPEIWPHFMAGEVWAHNAKSAEVPALHKSLAEYGISCEWLEIEDSLELFQIIDEQGHILNPCSKTLGHCAMMMDVPFDESEHHDALYDAEVLAKMLIRYAEGYRPKWDDVPESVEKMRKAQQEKQILHLGEFAAREKLQNEQKKSGLVGEKVDLLAELSSSYLGAQPQIVDVFDIGDKMKKEGQGQVDIARLDTSENNPLRTKVIAITGAFHISRDEIKRAIEAMGATLDGMTKNTDILLVGNRNVGLPKLAKYEKQSEKRTVALVVGDADLEALLYGDGEKFF